MEVSAEKDVDMVVWYYAEGKSKNDYTKKETVSISLPVGASKLTLTVLKGLIR